MYIMNADGTYIWQLGILFLFYLMLYLVLSAYYNYGDFDDYWKLNMLIYCKLYNVVIIKSSS